MFGLAGELRVGALVAASGWWPGSNRQWPASQILQPWQRGRREDSLGKRTPRPARGRRALGLELRLPSLAPASSSPGHVSDAHVHRPEEVLSARSRGGVRRSLWRPRPTVSARAHGVSLRADAGGTPVSQPRRALLSCRVLRGHVSQRLSLPPRRQFAALRTV